MSVVRDRPLNPPDIQLRALARAMTKNQALLRGIHLIALLQDEEELAADILQKIDEVDG